MTDCLVQNRAASSSPPPAEGFGVELVEALSIVRDSPHEPMEAAHSPSEQITVDSAANANLSSAEYKDLGEALASILAHSPRSRVSSGPSSLSSESAQTSLTSQDLAEVSGASGDEPASPAAQGKHSAASSDSEEEGSREQSKKKAIKLPQRKGGMQLWQFLYALLSDPQYKDLIEWTANVKEREFRLHEPEAIAVWWGDHKNKRNMSYDKLSRSLRYYYDKGIIRKINGQRYVYRFCVAPEVMYRHIGNSDCRPKLKPMSLAAQNALSTATNYQNMPYLQHMQPQPLQPGLFNPHFAPYLPHYSPFSPPTRLMQSQTYLQPTPVCSASPPDFGGYIQPSSQGYAPEVAGFQPHLLSPAKHLSQQPPTQFPGAPTDFHSCYPVEEAQLSSLMSEGSPSPQPISPASLSLAPQSSPLSPPPPYGWHLSFSTSL